MTLVDPRPVGVPNRLQLTFLADPLVPASGSFLLWGPNDLAGAAAEIGLPAGEPDTLRTVRPEGDSFIPIDLVARRAPLIPVARTLATLPVGSDWPAWSRPSDAVLAWSLAAKLAFERVADGHLVPTARGGHRAGTAVAAWRASVAGDPRIGRLAEAFPVSAHAVRALEDDRTLLTADEVLRSFLDAIADACARAGRRPAADVRPTDDRRLWSEAWPAALSSERPIIGELGDNANEIVAEVEQWSAHALGTERRSARCDGDVIELRVSQTLPLIRQVQARSEGHVEPFEIDPAGGDAARGIARSGLHFRFGCRHGSPERGLR